MITPLVVVRNQTTVVSDKDAWNLAWALNYQANYQFGPHWKSAAQVSFLPKGGTVPVGAWIMDLLDTSDVQGALGYHDEDGNEVPYARVFAVTSQQAGDSVSEVASHELLEMLVDPHVNMSALDSASNRLYAAEVGDPAQGNGYDVGAPYGRPTGVVVADFALPAWFDPKAPATQQTDYRGALHGPWTIGPQGYMSYLDLNNVAAGWQQTFGAGRSAAPVGDDRVDRRAGS